MKRVRCLTLAPIVNSVVPPQWTLLQETLHTTMCFMVYKVTCDLEIIIPKGKFAIVVDYSPHVYT